MSAAVLTPEIRQAKIERLRRFPDDLEAVATRLSDHELHTIFIPTQWTVAQIIHHLADSHMNAYIRTRLILTEYQPMLKQFDHDLWAKQADYKLPIESSLALLRGLHSRWCGLLDSLNAPQFARTGIHTALGEMSLDNIIILISTTCDEHLAQIERTLAAGNAK
ncbi:MAG: metal-dependent hydrolase [Anaerolineaceae bacterium]|nr:metal-dependent hydrolase [Anaerolineaceae bacterium]